MLKLVRNTLLAFAGATVFRSALGADTFKRMKMESKMPFGSLIFIVAKLETDIYHP